MAYTAQPGAAYNAQGSLNNFFNVQLTAAGLPAWMPSAVVNFEFPNQPLTFPSWSVSHLGSVAREVAEGRALDPGWRGAERVGLAQIDAWESYSRASGAGHRNVATMRDMAARVFATGASIAILDVYGTTANPTGTGTLVRAEPVEDMGLSPDPNPDIIHWRMRVEYRWLERVTAG